MTVTGVLAVLLFVSSPLPDGPAMSLPVKACTEAASLVARVPTFELTPLTTSTEPHICVPPDAKVATFSGRGSMKAFSARTPDEQLRDALTRAGWFPCLNCSADGPDGTVWAVGRDGVVVVVEGRWDGGDDTEPDAPLSDEYELVVRCLDRVRCERAPEEPEAPPGAPRTGTSILRPRARACTSP